MRDSVEAEPRKETDNDILLRPVLKGLAPVVRAVRPDPLSERGDSKSVHPSGQATTGALHKPVKEVTPSAETSFYSAKPVRAPLELSSRGSRGMS